MQLMAAQENSRDFMEFRMADCGAEVNRRMRRLRGFGRGLYAE